MLLFVFCLTRALSGTATAPYSGGAVYFALKSQNAAGWSALSNNAFWPQRHIYLPEVVR